MVIANMPEDVTGAVPSPELVPKMAWISSHVYDLIPLLQLRVWRSRN